MRLPFANTSKNLPFFGSNFKGAKKLSLRETKVRLFAISRAGTKFAQILTSGF